MDDLTTGELVQSKLGYIDQYELPVHVKFHDYSIEKPEIASAIQNYGNVAINKNNYNPWEFIKDELKNNESVEILVRDYFTGNTRWETITGFSEADSDKLITTKYDLDYLNEGTTFDGYHRI